jgi:hypothetical protein
MTQKKKNNKSKKVDGENIKNEAGKKYGLLTIICSVEKKKRVNGLIL